MFAALRRLASLWATVKSESVDEIKESIEEERQSSSFKFSSEERKVGKKSKFIKPETVAAKVSKKIKVEKKNNAPKKSKKSTKKVKKEEEEVEEEMEDTSKSTKKFKKVEVAKKETVAAKVSKKIKVEKKNAPKTSKKSTEKVKKEEVEEEVEDTESKLVKIAGISFRTSNCDKAIEKNGEVIGFDWFTTNHTVELIPDPENQYDPGAIKVLLSGEFVGFIPRDKTHIVDVTLEARVYEFRKNESLKLYQGQLKVNVGPKQHSNESAAQNIPLLSATI